MRPKQAWEIGASAALFVVVGLAAVNGYSWHLRRQKLNALLATELANAPLSTREVRRLLDQGADIRTYRSPSDTVLKAAAEADDVSLAERALDSGFSDDVLPGTDVSLLVWTAAHGSSGVVELLLTRGVPVDERRGGWRVTPLMSAAHDCHLATIRALLLAGADASLRDEAGRTALDIAREVMMNRWARVDARLAREGPESIRVLKEALVRKRRAALDWNAKTQGRKGRQDER